MRGGLGAGGRRCGKGTLGMPTGAYALYESLTRWFQLSNVKTLGGFGRSIGHKALFALGVKEGTTTGIRMHLLIVVLWLCRYNENFDFIMISAGSQLLLSVKDKATFSEMLTSTRIKVSAQEELENKAGA